MNFLKTAVTESKQPTTSLIHLLREEMGGWQKARSIRTVHASALTKETFCARQYALLDITKKKPKDEYVPTALNCTFDIGNAVADLVRERWLGHHSFGDWECDICGKKVLRQKKPAFCHPTANRDSWRYREIPFVSDTLQASGSIDLLVELGSQGLQIIELKIMAPEEFARIVAPLAEHRDRTRLYLKIIAESNDPLKKRINLEEGRVLYVSRGYGKANPEFNKEVLPFKEFVVERNDESLVDVEVKAKAVKDWRTAGLMPYGICPTAICPTAKNCPVQYECMGGNYKPQSIYLNLIETAA